MTSEDCHAVLRLGNEYAKEAETMAEERQAWDRALAAFWPLEDPRDDARWWRLRRAIERFRAARASAQRTGNGSQ